MTKNVVEPIVAILEGSTLSRTDKNMIYLRVTLSMTREIVALPRGSVERTNLITARQAILSKRKSFIQSIFSR
jgi:radical SAM superfamily enzyme